MWIVNAIHRDDILSIDRMYGEKVCGMPHKNARIKLMIRGESGIDANDVNREFGMSSGTNRSQRANIV